jgi:hypothetical protein
MVTVDCNWSGCGRAFRLNEQALETHLRSHRPASGGGPVRCQWVGCASGAVEVSYSAHSLPAAALY